MQPVPRKNPFSTGNILAFLLGIGLLAALLTQVNLSELVDSLLQVNAGMFALGGLAYLLKALIRALRFWSFERAAGHRVPFLRMARLTAASTLASQVMPLKLGELTYVYLLRTDLGAPVARGISGLMIIRVLDILAIALLFLGTAALVELPGAMANYFNGILALTALLVLALVLLILAGRLKLRAPGFIQRVPLLQKTSSALTQTLQDLSAQARRSPQLASLALAEWLANYAMYHFLLFGLGLTPNFLVAVVAVTLAAVVSLLPVNSFGNFGTQEAGWATGMLMMGYSQSVAVTTGFATHLLVMVYVTALGALAWLSYLIWRR